MFSWLHRRKADVTTPDASLLVPGLELLARGLADGLLAGETPSLFRGSGVEADGVRPYVTGDDIRGLDWRVTARTGKPHVREWVEERGLEAHLVVDRSASLHACADGRPGRVAIEASAALAAAAHRAGHRVGLLQITDRAEGHVPAGEGRHQLRWILGALATLRPTGTGTALAPVLRGLCSTLGGRALVVVVSDFRVCEVARSEVASALAGVARRHDLLPVRIRTPGPEDLPPVGLVSLADPESGRTEVLDTSDAEVRARLRLSADSLEAWWQGLLQGLSVRPVEIDPFSPLRPQLMVGLHQRRGRAA